MTNYINREGSPWRIALRKFLSNKLSLTSFVFIAVVTLVAFLGYLIIPDSTPWANNQHLEISSKKPGFKAKFFLFPKGSNGPNVTLFEKLFWGEANLNLEIPINSYRIENGQIFISEFTEPEDSVEIESAFALADVLFPELSSKLIAYSDQQISVDTGDKKLVLSKEDIERRIENDHIKTRRFILGTDRFGRDMLSRLILGARVSLSVGFIAVAISLFIGIVLGSTAGYLRGRYDDFVMWLINVVWSIPTLLMVIALTMVLGKGFWQIFVAVGLTMWVEVARVVRGQVMGIREKEFIDAAKIMGFGTGRIIFRHILPNVLGPVMIIAAGNFATAILLEAGLSFLGIGVQPPIPSWGTMIKDHYGYIIMDKAFLAIIPGVAIMLLVLAFTLIGNGLRDALDTKEIE